MLYSTGNSIIKKILPNWVHHFLIGKWDKNGVKKYFNNTNWIFFSHIINFISSFLIFAVVARYLGPENLGKLNYAVSFVAIFSIFASLGIDEILNRNLVREPEKEYKLIGTAVFSKLFFGIITFIVMFITSYLINDDFILTFLIGITGLTFILNPIGTLSVLFDSKVASKYNAYIRIFVAFFIPLIKLLIIFLGKGIIYFAAILVIEAIISSIILIYIYKTVYNRSIKKWTFDLKILKEILKDSWPLLLAGLSVSIYSRIDQVMIQNMLGSTSVGLYSGATKITSIIQTFPGIIVVSLFPALVSAKKRDYIEYIDRLKSLLLFTITMSIIIIVPVVIFAPLIISIILGEDFMGSISVLKIHAWGALGILVVSIIKNYLITENLGKIFFILTFVGAITNVILNIILIKSMGINGAAIATVISYFLIILSLLLFRKPYNDFIKIIKNR